MGKKIYMDVCCLNRPFDDHTQDRIHLEAEAILTILSHCYDNRWTLASSDIIDFELSRLVDSIKLQKIRGMYSAASKRLSVTQEVRTLSRSYQQGGIRLMDSLHLALCEAHGMDVLLTTDDKFLKAAARLELKTRVANPVAWLMEVTKK